MAEASVRGGERECVRGGERESVRGGERVLIAEVAKEHGYEKLKEEQLLAIDEFVSGKDVFVSLPTGFGKSLIYGLLPAVYDRVRGYTMPTSVAIVVSPLSKLVGVKL